MVKNRIFKSMILAIAFLFGAFLLAPSANAEEMILEPGTAVLYGDYDQESTELTTVIVELNEHSIVEAKHLGITQSEENLEAKRLEVYEEISKFTDEVTIGRKYNYVFSGFSLEVPSNKLMSLRTIPGIKSIFPNRAYTTSDFDEANIVDDVNAEMIYSMPYVGAPEAWSMGYTGEGITVAVLDTGIDYLHPRLQHAFGDYLGYDFIDNDRDPMDEHYHGTHVAGTIAALGFGIAPDVELVAYRVLNEYGSGSTSGIVAAIEQGVIDGVDVMNLSLGSAVNNPDYATSIALDNAMAEGVIAVTSNGNNGRMHNGSGTVGSPGSSREAISVGATKVPMGDELEIIADFSSRGPVYSTWMIKPDVSAPGVGIISTYPGGYYYIASGTSMAAPHVAAAAALVLQAHPEYLTEDVKAALMNTADELIDPKTGEPYPHNAQGAGSIRIVDAIKADTLVTPGSHSFGKFVKESGKEVRGEHFQIKNLSDEAKSYTFDVEFEGDLDAIKLMTSNNTKVEANSTQDVHFNVQVDTSKLAPGYYEGLITVSDGQEVINVPTIIFIQEPDYARINLAGVVPYIDGQYLVYGYLPAGAEHTQIQIYSLNDEGTAITGYVGTPIRATDVPPGYYIEIWDGTVNGEPLPEGKYAVVIWATYEGVTSYALDVFSIY
ncbi:S8 family serine peptidase [Haloplasma contractile]|uniref:Minor extracellular protease vpr protein n=1 Tax=Haloplasma contractile SSD-17B TaxID=1033810 RepID=F7PUE0_9MOLU|nr:S8 family serine peptidase [Haloplasma contractile]ERJ11788.1 Minor extracellular protease vpr protein [Haloplasma contractile SSD-17B]